VKIRILEPLFGFLGLVVGQKIDN